jgi:hypothetical protein
LADTSDNNRPPVPGNIGTDEGVREVTRSPKTVQGALFWTLLGGACMYAGVELACVIVAYGIGLSLQGGRGSRRSSFVVSCLASVLICVLAGPEQIPYALVGCLAAFAFSGDGSEAEVSTGTKCLAVLVLAALGAGIDATYAYLNGTNLPALIDQAVRTYAKVASQSTSADMSDQIATVRALAKVYWPMAFVSNAIVQALCAHVGGVLAARKRNARTTRTFSEFDAPVWVAIVFVVGVVLSLAGPYVPTWSSQVKMVGENVLNTARIALGLQGLAVAMWYAKKAGLGPLTRVLLVVFAFYLEASFLIVSVLGLVDIFVANFRELPRGKAKSQQDPRESKESA